MEKKLKTKLNPLGKIKLDAVVRLGRRFDSRASQAAGSLLPAHRQLNCCGGPATEFAHRPNDSSTSVCACVRACVYVCVQAGPARHVAQRCARTHTHTHHAHNIQLCARPGGFHIDTHSRTTSPCPRRTDQQH
jgi:hypothetical protein